MKQGKRSRGLIVFVAIGVLAVLILSNWSSAWATPPQDGLRQTVPTPAPGQASQEITPSTGGSLVTEDNTLAMNIPAGAVAENSTLIATPIQATEAPAAGAGFKALGKTFEIAVAVGGILQPGFTFQKPIQICFTYTDADVAAAGGNANNIVVQYYDAAKGEWVDVATTIDAANKKACIEVNHLTLFQLAANVGPTALPKTGSGGLDTGNGISGLIAGLAIAGLIVIASGSFLLHNSLLNRGVRG